jgi:transcriptional regulator with XRE-family HTH domain
MQDVASQLIAFMEKKGLKQKSLAAEAKVSQSTVSRALQGKPLRRGGAKSRLFKYAEIVDPKTVLSKAEASQRLIAAFDQVWARSDVHADAIVRIIDALAEIPAGSHRKQR